MTVRLEVNNDRNSVHSVNRAAFETASEAILVDTLRMNSQSVLSLVAECDGRIIGHIMFSGVTLAGYPDLQLMGLAPMAVLPDLQNCGVGSELVREGLIRCQEAGIGAVVVLGHPNYYPRFGFSASVKFGIRSEFDVPDEVFMVVEITQGYLKDKSGTIEYHEAFLRL